MSAHARSSSTLDRFNMVGHNRSSGRLTWPRSTGWFLRRGSWTSVTGGCFQELVDDLEGGAAGAWIAAIEKIHRDHRDRHDLTTENNGKLFIGYRGKP